MPTYHYVQNQGKLMMQSQENGQKPQFGQFFLMILRSSISKLQIFWKIGFIQIEGHIKTKKIVWAVFEKNIKVSDFGVIWEPFHEYLQIKNFCQKSGSVVFLPL